MEKENIIFMLIVLAVISELFLILFLDKPSNIITMVIGALIISYVIMKKKELKHFVLRLGRWDG